MAASGMVDGELFRLSLDWNPLKMLGLHAMVPTRPKVIIFDFDGVILDSADIKLRAYADVYAHEDPRRLAVLIEHTRLHGGITRRVKFTYYEKELFGRSGDDESVERLCRQYSDIVYCAVLSCPFIDGAHDLLQRCKGRTSMHVVSGTPEDELVEVVHERGLSQYFRSVTGAPSTKPEAFQRIALDEVCAREHILAIGDSMTEYLAAKDLGIPFLGIVSASASNPFPAKVPVLHSLRNAYKLLCIE